eukprot:1305022-Amphidinium_carterae.1
MYLVAFTLFGCCHCPWCSATAAVDAKNAAPQGTVVLCASQPRSEELRVHLFSLSLTKLASSTVSDRRDKRRCSSHRTSAA